MTEPKYPKTIAEYEARELLPQQRAVALAYMGPAKWVKKVAAEISGLSYGYSKRILNMPHVIKFMDDELRKVGRMTRAVRTQTVKETVRVSQGNLISILKEVMDDAGHISPAKMRGLSVDMSAAVKTFKITEERHGEGEGSYTTLRTEIGMHDKVAALGLLDKMLRISQEDERDEAETPDDLRLVGMIIEPPEKRKTIDAEFKVVGPEKKKEDLSWLDLPSKEEIQR